MSRKTDPLGDDPLGDDAPDGDAPPDDDARRSDDDRPQDARPDDVGPDHGPRQDDAPAPDAAPPTLRRARSVLLRHFGHADFRPGQAELVRAALEGRDSLGVLPTGGGKSVCYQVPALMLPGLALVVSPLISLMSDQVQRANASGLRARALTSAVDGAERARVLAAATSGGLDLLLVAPERLVLPGFLRLVGRASVSLVAVDEAHCISEWDS